MVVKSTLCIQWLIVFNKCPENIKMEGAICLIHRHFELHVEFFKLFGMFVSGYPRAYEKIPTLFCHKRGRGVGVERIDS